jgi:hypothetical protein
MNDRLLDLCCVCLIGAVAITATVGLVVSACKGIDPPPALIALSSACVGALSGLLGRPIARNQEVTGRSGTA